MVHRAMGGPATDGPSAPDQPNTPTSDGNAEVHGRQILGAYDDLDGEPVFVVADVTRDEAWVAVAEEESLDVESWA